MCETVYEEWQELDKNFEELEQINTRYLKILQEVTDYQQKCQKGINHQRYRLKKVKSTLKQLESVYENDKIIEMQRKISERELKLEKFEEHLPKTSSKYLRLFLGNIDVSFLNKESMFAYKNEYEKFKLTCHVIALVFAIVNLLMDSRALMSLDLFFLAWYYCTISIRESIMKTNGSRIKGWWRIHHILSTFVTAVLLIWPESKTWQLFKHKFIYYRIYSSLLQYLQYKYQSGVLYRLKALGEMHSMDITTDGFHSWMLRGLTKMLPFLFLGYFFQLYNAITLYHLTGHPEATWHVSVCSAAFFVFFVGNSLTTYMVIRDKVRKTLRHNYEVLTERLY